MSLHRWGSRRKEWEESGGRRKKEMEKRGRGGRKGVSQGGRNRRGRNGTEGACAEALGEDVVCLVCASKSLRPQFW